MKATAKNPVRPKPSPRRKISLRSELWELAAAVDAARLVLQQCSAERHGHDAQLVRDAANGAEGVLSLVHARLQMLDRVISGSAGGALLSAAHNRVVLDAGKTHSDDILFDDDAVVKHV